jgi:hypothetical protein
MVENVANNRQELFGLIKTDPEKARAMIAYETLLTLDKMADRLGKATDHIEALRIAITGPLHRFGDDTQEIRTDIAITDQLNRIAIEVAGRK